MHNRQAMRGGFVATIVVLALVPASVFAGSLGGTVQGTLNWGTSTVNSLLGNGPHSGGASGGGDPMFGSVTPFASDDPHRDGDKFGDPLSTDFLDAGNVHARLRYYGDAGGPGAEQAVGINISIAN